MTASLQVKSGMYYTVLSWKEGTKRRQKWISTELSVQGNNKRKAESMRKATLIEWEQKICQNYTKMLLSDYFLQWVDDYKLSWAPTTYSEYKRMFENTICPYFKNKNIMLQDCKAYHIEAFYTKKLKDGTSPNTISHYQAGIHSALKSAERREIIAQNPAAKVQLPKIERFRGDFYSEEELKKLIAASLQTKFKLPIMLAAWFGMRRGEICGLKWDAVNLQSKTLSVVGTITDRGDNKRSQNLTYRKTAKTKSSIRTYPMTDDIDEFLKKEKIKQAENRLKYGTGYCTKWIDYVCVDELGNLITPEYISCNFGLFLKKNNLRKIRFHDLRHTNATLLLGKGTLLQDLQAWLGHERQSTTSDYYGHIQSKTKERMALSMSEIIPISKINAG